MELNKIYNLNCLEGIKKIADKSIDLICTDPQYFLGMTSNGQKGNFKDLNICEPFFKELAKEFNRVLSDNGSFYIFTDWRGYAFYYPIFSQYLPVRNLIVWNKANGPGCFYRYVHELILFGCKDSKKIVRGTNVWDIKAFSSGATKTDGEKIHLAQKPLELIEKIVLDGSPEGGTVLDCFMGSGTTAVACINNKRNYIGFEIDETHYEKAIDRIKLYKTNKA